MAECRKVIKTIVSRKRYELTFWVDGDNAKSIKEALSSVPDVARLIDVNWRDESPNRWTLVFDLDEVIKVETDSGDQKKQEDK